MSTQFNLVGFFARQTRKYINGPVKTHPQVAVTLEAGIPSETVTKHNPDEWEHMADLLAQHRAKYTPFEKVWMVDWQLVPVEVHEQQEKAA